MARILAVDLAWAAGFFDGEGYVGCNPCGPNKQWKRLTLAIAQTNIEVLEKFRDIFDTGSVRGPYGPKTKNHNEYYQYAVSSDKEIIRIFDLMFPYLSFTKCRQFEDAIGELKIYKDKLEREGRNNQKLSLEDKKEVKRLYNSGYSQKDIAEIYSVVSSTVSLIVNNKHKGEY